MYLIIYFIRRENLQLTPTCTTVGSCRLKFTHNYYVLTYYYVHGIYVIYMRRPYYYWSVLVNFGALRIRRDRDSRYEEYLYQPNE